MNHLFCIILLIIPLRASEPEPLPCPSADYPWQMLKEDHQDWVSIYDNLPECGKIVFAMDDKDYIWVGKWNDRGVFCPIVVGQEWPMPSVNITHWSHVCTGMK
jgi:hypothetical protein